MIPQVIWVICGQVARTTVGRLAVDAIVKIIPLMSRKVAVSFFMKQPNQAVLVIRQMARIFRTNANRSSQSVASEALKSFRGILSRIDETSAVHFFSELWTFLSKDAKLLEIILKS